MSNKPTLLFLCTGNSCRSQMAEGFGKAIIGDHFDVYSAGIEAHGLNPHAVRVMGEVSVDITGHKSQHLNELPVSIFDYVVTVCGHADETCPTWPAKTHKIHHGFDDPPKLAKTAATEEEALGHYRRVRDEIRTFIATLPTRLKESQEMSR